MKYILILLVVIASGYFGYNYYQNTNNKVIKVTIESSVVQNAQATDKNVNLNTEYKAHIYDLKVKNNTELKFVLYPYENFRLKSGSNYYQLSADAAVEEDLQSIELNPGQETTGQISFHAPQNRNVELQFRTSEEADWQKL